MTDFVSHAERLIKEYRQSRIAVVLKRQRLSSKKSSDEETKIERYRDGLEALTKSLLLALEQYRTIFTQSLPEVQCILKVKSSFPNDLEVAFSLKQYSLRFISRPANPKESLRGALIDGMLHCESTYKGSDHKLESKAGLWGDIGRDAWGLNDENDKFLLFVDDLLPELVESLWNRATLGLIHSTENGN